VKLLFTISNVFHKLGRGGRHFVPNSPVTKYCEWRWRHIDYCRQHVLYAACAAALFISDYVRSHSFRDAASVRFDQSTCSVAGEDEVSTWLKLLLSSQPSVNLTWQRKTALRWRVFVKPGDKGGCTGAGEGGDRPSPQTAADQKIETPAWLIKPTCDTSIT